MEIKKVLLLTFFITVSFSLKATNYYINSVIGKDSNRGTAIDAPLQTMQPLLGIQLNPGDSVLFATGQKFTGMLSIINTRGVLTAPIVISYYPYKGNRAKPVLDAGSALNTILIQNATFIKVNGLEITAKIPYPTNSLYKEPQMRCGILVEITKDEKFENIELSDVLVHDVYFNPPAFVRIAAEVKTANGTQSYGWGIRVINNTEAGRLTGMKVTKCEVFNVSHTGIKITAKADGIQQLLIEACKVYQTGGPGMQVSGITGGHIHHNTIDHSGSTADSRNWGRGSGLWTWSCRNILIEHNRFENANGPGDSAGVHIDYNCSDVVVQYNLSANNAGGFCEILGNNYNCAYRYNISINDGFRVKGLNGAFQEGKIFWLSGYQGNDKKNAGPYNSYFYNNSIYVARQVVPKIAMSSSADGVLIANNIFYFEGASQLVAGDQKKKEIDDDGIPNVVFQHNLFLRPDNWPAAFPIQDDSPLLGDAGFKNKGGLQLKDYVPANKKLIVNNGISIQPIPNDSIGLRIGLQVKHDILGNLIQGLPDLGAIEIGGSN